MANQLTINPPRKLDEPGFNAFVRELNNRLTRVSESLDRVQTHPQLKAPLKAGGHRLMDVGTAVSENDAIPLGQLKDEIARNNRELLASLTSEDDGVVVGAGGAGVDGTSQNRDNMDDAIQAAIENLIPDFPPPNVGPVSLIGTTLDPLKFSLADHTHGGVLGAPPAGGVAGQVAFFTSAFELGGDPGMTYNAATDTLTLGELHLTIPLAAIYGGTGFGAYLLGDTLYANTATTLAKLAGNITLTRNFLRQTGTGAISAAPAWDTLIDADIPAILSANARVAVRKNNAGATIGTRRRIDFIEGAGITLTITDDAGSEEVDVTITATTSTGATGQQGPPGTDGEDGEPGPPGSQGSTGNAGPTGATGSMGTAGPPGADGDEGEPGPIGPPGSQGTAGTTGATGAPGATGSPGTQGSDGEDGDPGPPGAQGLRGFTGIQGPPGADGADGEDGFSIPGPQGSAGPAGQPGPPGSIFGGGNGDGDDDGSNAPMFMNNGAPTGFGVANQITFWGSPSTLVGDPDFTFNPVTNAVILGRAGLSSFLTVGQGNAGVDNAQIIVQSGSGGGFSIIQLSNGAGTLSRWFSDGTNTTIEYLGTLALKSGTGGPSRVTLAAGGEMIHLSGPARQITLNNTSAGRSSFVDSAHAANLDYTLPTAHVANGVLRDDGTGVLSWIVVNAAGQQGPPGIDGEDGVDGTPGRDGRGLTSTSIPLDDVTVEPEQNEYSVTVPSIPDLTINAGSRIFVFPVDELDQITFETRARAGGQFDLVMHAVDPETNGGLKGRYQLAYVVA